jgi:hypothetical protein
MICRCGLNESTGLASEGRHEGRFFPFADLLIFACAKRAD